MALCNLNRNQNCFYCQVSLRLPGICFGILVPTINIKSIISTEGRRGHCAPAVSTPHRAHHYCGGREHPSCAHRGRGEERAAHRKQRHVDRGQEEVPVPAAHLEGNVIIAFAVPLPRHPSASHEQLNLPCDKHCSVPHWCLHV